GFCRVAGCGTIFRGKSSYPTRVEKRMGMIDRSHPLLLFNATILLVMAGCAVPKAAQFRMPFVPPAPPATGVTFTPDPAPPPPNTYLNGESPFAILGQYRQVPGPTRSDLSMVQAEEAYQKGRKSYQAGDKERARRQFDRAIDLLFEASENPTDRAAFE